MVENLGVDETLSHSQDATILTNILDDHQWMVLCIRSRWSYPRYIMDDESGTHMDGNPMDAVVPGKAIDHITISWFVLSNLSQRKI